MLRSRVGVAGRSAVWTGVSSRGPLVVAQRVSHRPCTLTSPGRSTPGATGARCRSSCGSPWPGRTRVSGGSVKSLSSIELMIVGKSPPGNLVAPGPAGEQRVAAEQDGRPLDEEAHRPRRVAGRVDGAQPQAADLDHRVVLEELVVRREHLGVLGRDVDLVAGVAQLGHGLDVVPVAVGLEHRPDAELRAQVEQPVVLVGGVEQHRLARLGAPQDVHVVVDRADDDLVDLEPGVGVEQRAHPASLPRRTPAGAAPCQVRPTRRCERATHLQILVTAAESRRISVTLRGLTATTSDVTNFTWSWVLSTRLVRDETALAHAHRRSPR